MAVRDTCESAAADPGSRSRAKAKTRIKFLDALRGIAAGLVVLQHAAEATWPKFLGWSLHHVNFGLCGVVIFFWVSGYVIPDRRLRSTTGAFWRRRLLRLLPPYWASLIVVGALATIHQQLAVASDHGLRFWLAQVGLVQDLLRVPYAQGVYWTLTLELAFYALCTCLLRTPRAEALAAKSQCAGRQVAWACWAMVVAIMAITLCAPLVLQRTAPAGRTGLLLMAWVGAACAGTAAGHLRLRGLLSIVVGAAVTLFVGLYLRFASTADDGDGLAWHLGPVLASWGLAIACIGLFILARRRSLPTPLCWMGEVSYSAYLVHCPIIAVLPSTGASTGDFALRLLSSYATAAAFHRLVERPSMRLATSISRIFERSAEPRTIQAQPL